MWKYSLSFTLNLPWTILGFLLGIVSVPKRIHFQSHAIILNVRKLWWQFGYLKGVRAANLGHVVLLGPKLLPKDLEHELIHVEQYARYPLIFPLLYYYELFKKGYRNNRFEDEAYHRAGNFYKKTDI